jgi:hypothetical protein
LFYRAIVFYQRCYGISIAYTVENGRENAEETQEI